jgi:hypothetical protein
MLLNPEVSASNERFWPWAKSESSFCPDICLSATGESPAFDSHNEQVDVMPISSQEGFDACVEGLALKSRQDRVMDLATAKGEEIDGGSIADISDPLSRY